MGRGEKSANKSMQNDLQLGPHVARYGRGNLAYISTKNKKMVER